MCSRRNQVRLLLASFGVDPTWQPGPGRLPGPGRHRKIHRASMPDPGPTREVPPRTGATALVLREEALAL